MKKLLFISLMFFSVLLAGAAYTWSSGEWSECSAVCGTGTQTRTVVCKDFGDSIVDDSYCSSSPKPDESKLCIADPCNYIWEAGTWGECSEDCGGGTKARVVSCKEAETGNLVDDSNCDSGAKPIEFEACNIEPCAVDEDFVEEDLVDEDVADEELIDENDETQQVDENVTSDDTETPDEVEVKDENQSPDETETPDETEVPDESENNDINITSDDDPSVDETTNDADTTEEKGKSDGCSCLVI